MKTEGNSFKNWYGWTYEDISIFMLFLPNLLRNKDVYRKSIYL